MNFSLSSNVDQVLGYTARIHPQYRFGAALALTSLVRKGKDAAVVELNRAIDKPTPFSQQGFFITPARKDKLVAVVGIKDKQSGYLRYQVEGGSRSPRNVALRLPSQVQLNEYGNIPAGLIKQLIARAKANKRATTRQSKRFGVSTELDLFYGEPGDGRPAGIYKRVVLSPTRHQLVPVIVFPKRSASYRQRFDFFGVVDRVIRREANAELRAAWTRAIASAR